MERNSNKWLKKLILLLLLFVGLGASVTAGAYWASTFTAASPIEDATGDLTVTIGEGESYELQTTLAFGTQSGDTTLPLVPTNYAVSGSSTDTREININGVWSVVPEGEYTLESATGKLSAVINSSSIAGVDPADFALMFTVTVQTNNVNIAFGSSEQIVVKVVFHTEPASKALYDLVANGTLTINITLSVVADVVE